MEIDLWQFHVWAGWSQRAGAGFSSEVGGRGDSLSHE
jgi:hypothetical protein